MAQALDYRLVEQDRDAKVLKRDVLWQHETRRPGASGFDPSRIITVYGTDESVDRHNTKIRVDGWDMSDYQKNPTILWLHNMDEAAPKMPLGSCIGITREEYERASGKANGKRLAFDIEFPTRDTYKFADLACDMWKQGHLRAASVGFRNLERRELNPKSDKEEMEAEGYDLKAGWAAELTKNALLELSLVPVGSNPNALAKALRDAAPVEMRGLLDHDEKVQGEIDEAWVSSRLEALRVALTPPPAAPLSTPVVVTDEDETVEETIHDVLDENPELELALARELEVADRDRVVAPTLTEELKEFKDELRTQLKTLNEAILTLTAEIKASRGASTGEGLAPSTPAEPAPSHLDLLIAENVDAFDRLGAIFPRRS